MKDQTGIDFLMDVFSFSRMKIEHAYGIFQSPEPHFFVPAQMVQFFQVFHCKLRAQVRDQAFIFSFFDFDPNYTEFQFVFLRFSFTSFVCFRVRMISTSLSNVSSEKLKVDKIPFDSTSLTRMMNFWLFSIQYANVSYFSKSRSAQRMDLCG